MMEGSYKATKGLIKVRVKIELHTIQEIQITGDFFMYPEDKLWDLEHALEGTQASRDQILSRVQAFYKHTGVVTPGMVPGDFVEAIIRAIGSENLS